MTVYAVDPARRTNAQLIADCAQLGYLDGHVLDATYGLGRFWTRWQPERLTTNDLHTPADLHADARRLPFPNGTFDTVVFDPPYRLNGRPDLATFDTAYGIGQRATRTDRHALLVDGALECGRVARRHLLVKCQDQIESGRYRQQTRIVTDPLTGAGWNLHDVLHLVTSPRPQPPGRRQLHARRNLSTLLVFAQ